MWLGWWTDWQDLPSGQKLLQNCNSSMEGSTWRGAGSQSGWAGWEVGRETELETNPVFLFFAFFFFFPRKQDISAGRFRWKEFRTMNGIIQFISFRFFFLGALNQLDQIYAHHHDLAQQWQPLWDSCQCPLGVFKPPQISGGSGEPSAQSLLLSPSPLSLCSALPAGSRKFPLPSLLLLIATTSSTRVLVLIWFFVSASMLSTYPLNSLCFPS